MTSINVTFVLAYASAAAALLAAAFCSWKARRSVGGWVLAVGFLLLACERLTVAMTLQAPTLGRVGFWQSLRFAALSFSPGVWLLFSLTFGRGAATAFIRKWRFTLGAAFLVPPMLALGFRDDLFSVEPTQRWGWICQLTWVGLALFIIVLLSSILAITHLERTFSASVGTIRWRIKFVLLAVALLLSISIYTSTQVLLYRAVIYSTDSISSIAAMISAAILLRYISRLDSGDSDVYPSASVLRGSVTILFVGVYLIAVGVLAAVVTNLGGDTAFSLKAFVLLLSLAGLAVILQSDRAHLKLRQFVSLHFKRPVHDYQIVWRRFSNVTAACLVQEELCHSVVAETAKLFDALSVTLWLRQEDSATFVLAASTTRSSGNEVAPSTGGDLSEAIAHFETCAQPINIDASREPWARVLQQWHPLEFPNGGMRVCAPLVRHHALLGLLILGDRVGGVPFTPQDFEMLGCITEHIASSLLNITLSDKLLRTKELETFQTMAAFLVHDLKNSVSTLNVLFRNLPTHFGNPSFREDALRSVANTVLHMNGLISRIGMLRNEVALVRNEVDLNEVVENLLGEFKGNGGPAIKYNPSPLPRIALDREKIESVVRNLMLNALDATKPGGTVSIDTAHRHEWVTLTVADSGCGMSKDFVRRSLFRPFHTTKKNGLGIGVFQSKMIVEAHGGRISVRSEPNEGTTFSIHLPAYGQ